LGSGKIGQIRSSSIIVSFAREHGAWGPTVGERNTYTADGNSGANMLDIGIGHIFATVTHLLGDLVSVSATTANDYPTVTVLDKEGKPTGRTLLSSAPTQIAFTGLFKSGAVSSAIFRAGLPASPGRRQFLWEIDGEEGSIRLDGDDLASPMIQIQDPKVYLNGELVEFEQAAGPSANLTSAWEAFAKGEGYTDLDDALKNRLLLEGIARSAQEGRVVNL